MRALPISEYSNEKIGIVLFRDGQKFDADEDVMATITMPDETTLTPITATQDDVGMYSIRVPTAGSSVRGNHTVLWTYDIATEGRQTTTFYNVVEQMPYWDALNSVQRQSVVNVYHKVSDTFDSTEGGPYLWELYQTQFNAFETISRLMTTDALTYINYMGQPAFIPPYAIGAGAAKQFPVAWSGLLERATYMELAAHLSRSYIEIPDEHNVPTAYLDRKRYRAEWRAEADSEKALLDAMLIQFKRKFLTASTKRAMLLQGVPGGGIGLNPARPFWNYTLSRI